jgi:hypothetical protein
MHAFASLAALVPRYVARDGVDLCKGAVAGVLQGIFARLRVIRACVILDGETFPQRTD